MGKIVLFLRKGNNMKDKNIDYGRNTILLVDDDLRNRSEIVRFLNGKFSIVEVDSCEKAMNHIKNENKKVAAILIGLCQIYSEDCEIIDFLKKNYLLDHIPVIMMTEDTSVSVLAVGRKYKLADIIYRPIEKDDFIRRVENAIDLCRCEREFESIVRQQAIHLVNQYRAMKEVVESETADKDVCDSPTDFFSVITEKELTESKSHIRRIREYTRQLAECVMERYPKYGLSKENIENIVKASVIHDIGKSVIPDSIFLRNGQFSDRGFVQLKKQPIAGSELIHIILEEEPYEVQKYAYDICRYCYEKWDGKGYPEGISKDEIPLCAQIVGLVHRYDSLLYSGKNIPLHSRKTAVRTILDAEYKGYNPDLLECFEMVEKDFDKLSKFKYFTH